MRRALRWFLMVMGVVVVLVAGCAEPTQGYITSYRGGYLAGQEAVREGSRSEATKQKARRDLHSALRELFTQEAFEEGYADGLAGRPSQWKVSNLR